MKNWKICHGFIYIIVWGLLSCTSATTVAPRTTTSSNFNLIFDYRFDNGYFRDHPERKAMMDYIETLYESVITSSHSIAPGTRFEMRRDFTSTEMETVDFSDGVNGMVILVYAYDISQYVRPDGTRPSSPFTGKAYGGTTGIPNVGKLEINTAAGNWFFDSSPSTHHDLPSATHYDAMSTVMHEVGHALKILRSYQAPFIVIEDNQDLFDGPNVRKFNQGNALPLDKDSSHISASFSSTAYLVRPHLDRFMMHGSDIIQGFRTLISKLDLAMLDDLGYDVNYENTPLPLYGNPDALRAYQRSRDVPSLLTRHQNPVGLWQFDSLESSYAAITGYPMHYMPPAYQTGLLSDLFHQSSLTIPAGGYLIVNHSIPKTPPSIHTARYTFLMDIQIDPNESGDLSLFNTNYHAKNAAELTLLSDGRLALGQQKSTKKLDLNVRNTIVLMVDSAQDSIQIFGNGQLFISHDYESRYSLYSLESGTPLFILFGAHSPNNRKVQLFHAALWDKPLTGEDIQALSF